MNIREKLSGQITFTDEQSMLLDTATEFFRDKAPSSFVREQIESDSGFAAEQWQEMAALGWTGVAVPEAFGGSGLGLAAAVPIAEPMGRHLSATPWLPTQLFVQASLCAADALRSELLGAVVAGSAGSVAVFEQEGDWHLHTLTAKATLQGDSVALAGVKTLVLNAPQADYVWVSLAYEGAPALALLRQDQIPATALQRETIIDETRRSYRLTLDGISVPPSALITGTAAVRALDLVRNAALLLLAAEAAGGIAGVLAVVVEYLNTRTAFGRKIGAYQGLKHPTVDILIGLERTRSHVYHAASLLDAREDAEVALRMAKAEASDSFAFAGDRAIQFHGGFGFTYDCDAQLFLRRALWTQYAYGDAAHHRKHLCAALFAQSA